MKKGEGKGQGREGWICTEYCFLDSVFFVCPDLSHLSVVHCVLFANQKGRATSCGVCLICCVCRFACKGSDLLGKMFLMILPKLLSQLCDAVCVSKTCVGSGLGGDGCEGVRSVQCRVKEPSVPRLLQSIGCVPATSL